MLSQIMLPVTTEKGDVNIGFQFDSDVVMVHLENNLIGSCDLENLREFIRDTHKYIDVMKRSKLL